MAAIIYSRGFTAELESRYEWSSFQLCGAAGKKSSSSNGSTAVRAELILLAHRAAHSLEFFRSPLARFRQSRRVQFVRRELLSIVRQVLHGLLVCRADQLVG